MLGRDAKVARRVDAPPSFSSEFNPHEARRLAGFKRAAEVTDLFEAEKSDFVPFDLRLFVLAFTGNVSVLFFMTSPRSPLAGKDRL